MTDQPEEEFPGIDSLIGERAVIEGEAIESALVPTNAGIMPAMSVGDALERRNQMNEIVSGIMVEDKDYGTIPGTQKPTLYKAGAEKLTTFFGLTVKFIEESTTEEWDSDEPFFYYRQKCRLYKGSLLIAEASASANSREDRYRWRWVTEKPKNYKDLETRVSSIGHFRWQIDKAETTGQYGKPQEYWDKFAEAVGAGMAKKYDKEQSWNKEMAEFIEIETTAYRVPNPDIFTLVNTILKMAQKRALVAATLIACDASDFFTQDMEDIANKGEAVASKKKAKKKAAADTRRDERAGNAMINWPLDEQIKHAKALSGDPDAKDADLTTVFWTLGRSHEIEDDMLKELVQEYTHEDNTAWRMALESLVKMIEK